VKHWTLTTLRDKLQIKIGCRSSHHARGWCSSLRRCHPRTLFGRHPARIRAVAPRAPAPTLTSAMCEKTRTLHRQRGSVCRSGWEIVFSSRKRPYHNPVGQVFGTSGQDFYCVAGVLVLRWSQLLVTFAGWRLWEIRSKPTARGNRSRKVAAAFCVVLKRCSAVALVKKFLHRIVIGCNASMRHAKTRSSNSTSF